MIETKRLAILGSTGSIGTQTLDIVRALPDYFDVVGLTAGHNIGLLEHQIEEFRPDFIHLEGRDHKPAGDYRILSPEDIVRLPQVDMVVIATSGKAGLLPVLAALKAGKTVALANKESLVIAGEIITSEARLHSARILPVDSEHSALFQCLNGECQTVESLILTASGGPFRGYSHDVMKKVTAVQALNHPSWKMGRKVTIDSATLMNKGLEVIEAHWLFDVPFDRIRVLVHPQSIVHSMVEFADGSFKAQLSYPDMRIPIQYALSYPERLANPQLPKLDWSGIQALTFQQPDTERFPCLKLAVEAGKQGGTYPAVLSASDEEAVELFLSGKIAFTEIAELVEMALSEHKPVYSPSLEQILEADAWARKKVRPSSGR